MTTEHTHRTHPQSERRARSRGQVMPMAAFSLIALVAVAGLAVDTGYFFEGRRRLQTAADAAALAGAWQLRRAGTTQVVTAANSAATANGFTNGASGTTIAIRNPPTSGYYLADPNYVEAIITQDRPSLFMGILGLSTGRASARAVAGVEQGPNCVYALSPTRTGLNVGGSTSSLSAACGIVVDSSDSAALSAGSGTVFGTQVTVTGGVTGNCNTTDPAGCRTGIPPQPDPLASFPTPQFSSTCDHTNFSVNGVQTVYPGVYCNGIQITSGALATFQPGTYIIVGGGFSVTGNSTVQGTGVTFYLTASSKYSYGALSIGGGTLGFLNAPTSGPMEGMLFFQDRTITPKNGGNSSVAGGSNLSLSGIFYFPTTDLAFSGNGQLALDYTVVVAWTLSVSGHTSLSANFSTLQNGNPVKRITLAE
jgi:Flp pilus assembly protein TadG